MKRIISMLLVLAMMISSFCLTAYAENEIIEEKDENEIVATVSLCSCLYVFPIKGHTWIYVENLSDKVQRVGLYDLPVGEGMSVGTYSFSASDGWGVYYNVECYRQNRDNNFENIWSVTKELTQSELDTLSKRLANYVNYWDFYFNCAFFAFSIWNSVSRDFLIPLVLPGISHIQVMLLGAKKGVLQLYEVKPEQVFRQRGSLGSAYLEPVSDKTLNG